MAATPPPAPRAVRAVFVGMFVLVPAMFIVLGAVTLTRALAHDHNALAADGVITGAVETTTGDDDATAYCPVVAFAPPGADTTSFTDADCGTHRPTAGDRVTVLYDPHHPRDAVVRSRRRYLVPGVALAGGLAVETGFAYAWRRERRERRER